MKIQADSRPEGKATFNTGKIRTHLDDSIQKLRFSFSLFSLVSQPTHTCVYTQPKAKTKIKRYPRLFNMLQGTAFGSIPSSDFGPQHILETNDIDLRSLTDCRSVTTVCF